MSNKRLKLKLRVFLAGHIVAMVTYCATKLTATYSHDVCVNKYRVVIMAHQKVLKTVSSHLKAHTTERTNPRVVQ